jgi:hypothetical protein
LGQISGPWREGAGGLEIVGIYKSLLRLVAKLLQLPHDGDCNATGDCE